MSHTKADTIRLIARIEKIETYYTGLNRVVVVTPKGFHVECKNRTTAIDFLWCLEDGRNGHIKYANKRLAKIRNNLKVVTNEKR